MTTVHVGVAGIGTTEGTEITERNLKTQITSEDAQRYDLCLSLRPLCDLCVSAVKSF